MAKVMTHLYDSLTASYLPSMIEVVMLASSLSLSYIVSDYRKKAKHAYTKPVHRPTFYSCLSVRFQVR